MSIAVRMLEPTESYHEIVKSFGNSDELLKINNLIKIINNIFN